MNNTIKYPFYIRLAFSLISIIGITYIFCMGKNILTPVLLAFLFSVLLLPIASFLNSKLRFPNAIAVTLTVLVFVLFIAGILAFISYQIKPQYIILKPSFVGGFRGTQEWISLAEKHQIGWWITSALESNIGLNAIAQWTFLQHNLIPQGLGTGALYTNNFDCPLKVDQGQLWYDTNVNWDCNLL